MLADLHGRIAARGLKPGMRPWPPTFGLLDSPTVGALTGFVPTADSLRGGSQYVIDGTLFPCWPWRSRKDLWSGKHKTTSLAALVARGPIDAFPEIITAVISLEFFRIF